MKYFIVEAPYDKCFDLFFKDEMGFPSFYRISELLPFEAGYDNLTLITPYPIKEPSAWEKISSHINTAGVKCLLFGEGLETNFAFDGEGKLQIHPLFKEALHSAVIQFLNNEPQKPRLSP